MSQWFGNLEKYAREITASGLVLLTLLVFLQWQANHNLQQQLERKAQSATQLLDLSTKVTALPQVSVDLNEPLTASELRTLMNRIGLNFEHIDAISHSRFNIKLKQMPAHKLNPLLERLQRRLISLDTMNINSRIPGRLDAEIVVFRVGEN